MRDRLSAYRSLQRLRQTGVDKAARTLAEALAAEREQAAREQAHRDLMTRECRDGEASELSEWLVHARQQGAALSGEARAQAVLTEAARESLAQRRVEAEAVRKAMAALTQRRAAEQARKEQMAMDEVALVRVYTRRP